MSTEVRLGDGSAATLAVGMSTQQVTNPASPSSVAFSITRDVTEVVTALGRSLAFTVQTVAPTAQGTDGYGQVIGGSIRYRQRTPAATWSFRHPLGRTPQVSTYIAVGDGPELEQVDTSVIADDTTVVVTWPYPMSGELIVQ